jgi:hypothetical protein
MGWAGRVVGRGGKPSEVRVVLYPRLARWPPCRARWCSCHAFSTTRCRYPKKEAGGVLRQVSRVSVGARSGRDVALALFISHISLSPLHFVRLSFACIMRITLCTISFSFHPTPPLPPPPQPPPSPTSPHHPHSVARKALRPHGSDERPSSSTHPHGATRGPHDIIHNTSRRPAEKPLSLSPPVLTLELATTESTASVCMLWLGSSIAPSPS